jgi:hypothetical protein
MGHLGADLHISDMSIAVPSVSKIDVEELSIDEITVAGAPRATRSGDSAVVARPR